MPNTFYDNPDYANLLVQYSGDLKSKVDTIPEANTYIIDNNYAIVSIKASEYEKVIKLIDEIVYIELDGIYTLNEISPIDASNAPLLKSNPYLNLNGTGILIGLIDTGIDYLSQEFMHEDDTTRIIRIWDQTISNNNPNSQLIIGTEYTEEQINQAIQLKIKNGDPYSIVPSKDTIGHGTKMANIIGGRGKNPDIAGIASNSSFAVVKLCEASKLYSEYYKPYGDAPKFRGSDILVAIKYLYDLSRKLSIPLVIYLPLGSNIGAHDGSTVLERYIDTISQTLGVLVVTSTGNQGNADNHASGEFTGVGNTSTLEVFTPPEQTGLYLEIYINKPDKAILSIVSPSGEVIDKLNPKAIINTRLDRPITIKFVYEGTTMDIFYASVDPPTGDQKITIRASNVKTGIWQFKLTASYVVSKTFNSWLLQKELLAPGTKFLNSSPKTTLTTPGTSEYILTTGYYNQNNNSIVSESGRGFTRYDLVKPIIASGGINATTISPGDNITTVSGGSVAGAVLSGCCALILQWGIIQKNDPTMYALTVQTYLIRGTNKRPGDTYPNTEWGYGTLDILGVFNSIRDLSRSSKSFMNEFYLEDIFIRLP